VATRPSPGVLDRVQGLGWGVVNGVQLFFQTLVDPSIEQQLRDKRARSGTGFVYGQGFTATGPPFIIHAKFAS
jgi:hypothetical protein